jgi:AcrR family transcriptional regulator
MPKGRSEPTPDRAPGRTREPPSPSHSAPRSEPRSEARSEALPERCVHAARAIIDAQGVEALSLREVARRLGVSHQAPYKHFASRDHLLAEVVRRAFEAFARHLDARPAGATADEDLGAMGRAYLAYAHAHPLQYRLMFGTPLPDPAEHPAMMASARHAFALLRDGLARMHAEAGRTPPHDAVDQDALFVWGTLHGLASVRHAPALGTLELSAPVLAGAEARALAGIGVALAAGASDDGTSAGRA